MKRTPRSILLAILAFLSWSVGALAAQNLQVSQDRLTFILRTQSASTILAVTSNGTLVTVGEGLGSEPAEDFVATTLKELEGSWTRHTVPSRGGFPAMAPAIEVVFHDGIRGLRLVYTGHEIIDENTLRIDLADQARPFRVSALFRVFPELDLIERSTVLQNLGTGPVKIENAASANLVLDPGNYDLLHLSGRWGEEFGLERTSLTGGAKVLESRGMRFHHLSPWYLIRPAGDNAEEEGPVWFGALGWSGNWSLRFEKVPTGELQVCGGINFWDTNWTIPAGGRFTTPSLVTGFCRDGAGGASRRMHRYIRRQILPETFRGQLRPVLYNSWYATTFDVNAEQQVALAKTARDVGVELFVMDDGWFKGRADDHAGLGDWTPDPTKFPSGLRPMIESINRLGMKFGLWVEPEMANPDSDLLRTHPEWALQTPGLRPLEGRNQLVLNMARDDVKEHTLEWLTTLLRENPIEFVKWDFNRDLAEVDWPGVTPELAREFRIRYVQNVYEIHDQLRRRFPKVWLEGCAGGGGRVDLGLLRYVDQIWTSDNTNPSDRLFIQYGYSYAFPAKTMVSWTTDDDWRGARPSLEYRFRVAMSGVLGVGNDLRKWGSSERETARREIERYKLIRPIVQDGDLYRLGSPFESDRVALCYVSEDKSSAVVFMYNLQDSLPGARPRDRKSDRLIVRGLDPAGQYKMDLDLNDSASGSWLIESGLPWLPSGDYQARIVRLVRQP